tara:strand:+ start:1630 stop:2466 length:837 start_codon:yes stop_codon:yes gene_type:complete
MDKIFKRDNVNFRCNKMKNKNIISIITGGAGFLGKQIFESLLELKHKKIIIIDNNKKSIESFKKDYKKFKNKFIIYEADICSERKILEINSEIINKFKKIHILINNAAIDLKPQKKRKKKVSFFDTSISSWNREVAVSLTGSLICSKIFCRSMSKNKFGIVLNISSDLSVIAPDQRLYEHLNIVKPISYSVVKHGLLGFTKYLASHLANKNIRVNALSPGGISNKQDKLFVKKIKSLIPLNRMAKKNEYKEVIKFLCSERSSYMTGQNIIVDGGRSVI